MGLDMYLSARKLHRTQYQGTGEEFVRLPKPEMDGFERSHSTAEVCYWRKNHWLHGFIVEEFADGEDECQEITLLHKDLVKIYETLEKWRDDPDALSATEGFFFGTGDEEWRDMCRDRITDDLVQIRKAIDWLADEDFDKEWREVFYQASW